MRRVQALTRKFSDRSSSSSSSPEAAGGGGLLVSAIRVLDELSAVRAGGAKDLPARHTQPFPVWTSTPNINYVCYIMLAGIYQRVFRSLLVLTDDLVAGKNEDAGEDCQQRLEVLDELHAQQDHDQAQDGGGGNAPRQHRALQGGGNASGSRP